MTSLLFVLGCSPAHTPPAPTDTIVDAGHDLNQETPDAPAGDSASPPDSSTDARPADEDTAADADVHADADAAVAGLFGDPCDSERACGPEFYCFYLEQGATSGYCTQDCYQPGELCPGEVPPRSRAFCTVPPGNGPLTCIFYCLLEHPDHDHLHTYACPQTLRCGAIRPTGDHYCEP